MIKYHMAKFYYNESKLLADLQRVAKLLDKRSVSRSDYLEYGNYSDKTYRRRFGSWNSAVLTAGLQPNVRKNFGEKKPRNANSYVRMGVRYSVLKRDNFRCVFCGRSPARDSCEELHLDHIMPVALGGLSVKSNLQTLCSDCNWGKGIDIA